MSATTKVISKIGKLKPSTTTFFLCDIQDRFRPLIHNSETIISTSKYLTSVATALSIPIVATQQYTKVFGSTVVDCFEGGQLGMDALMNGNNGHGHGHGHGQLKIFEKKKFSMMTDEVTNYCHENLNFTVSENGSNDSDNNEIRNNVVLFGIEAHVCVQQTCLDLIEMGKDVHIVVDCVSSQQGYDREIALKRMENAGAFLTTAQSLAFMLMESKLYMYSYIHIHIHIHCGFYFCFYYLLTYYTHINIYIHIHIHIPSHIHYIISGADHPNFKEVSKLTVGHMKLPNQFNDAYK
jgi:nicotinamidase-related amidase